ncbi:MAG: aldo/keto reductase [Firmicutes bacterium]|nr:aldo/keto reductase [Bacillota bacterium]
MNYRINKKNNDKISALAFGCMRFPKCDSEAEQMIMTAIERGVNFYDTAYVYGNSEERLGAILKKNNIRSKIFLATKLPTYLIKTFEDFDKIFERQLSRLQTDYIDYYFIHNVTDLAIWERLISLGAHEWIEKKKAEGKIKNIGVSYHGGKEEFIKIIDSYPWEFTMLQYNYADENNQAGKSGFDYAVAKGIPVLIMEPLKGGQLTNALPQSVKDIFTKENQTRTLADWALRWVLNHENALTVLSGMGSLSMVEENIITANEATANSLSESELKMFKEVKTELVGKIAVPCTGCGYCMPCPKGVDIPSCFGAYNNIALSGKKSALFNYINDTTLKQNPTNAGNCNSCKACEKRCPQFIAIADELKKVKKSFEKLPYKIAKVLVRKKVLKGKI